MRWETIGTDWRQGRLGTGEIGDRRDRRQEMEERRWETENGRQDTEEGRKETEENRQKMVL